MPIDVKAVLDYFRKLTLLKRPFLLLSAVPPLSLFYVLTLLLFTLSSVFAVIPLIPLTPIIFPSSVPLCDQISVIYQAEGPVNH